MLINTVRGWLRTQLIRIPGGSKFTFPRRVRETLLALPDGMPTGIERQLVVIDELTAQIRVADGEIKQLAQGNETCRLLMTAPGVGPLTSLYFYTVVDDVSRFKGAQALQSYLGLTPGEHSSSLRKSRTSITKAGSSQVRRVLVQACWAASTFRKKDPLVQWGAQVAARRGKKIAVVAMARKLSGILFAMWRDNRAYNRQLVREGLTASESAE